MSQPHPAQISHCQGNVILETQEKHSLEAGGVPEHPLLPGMTSHGITESQQGLGFMDPEDHPVPTPCPLPLEGSASTSPKMCRQSKAPYPMRWSRSTQISSAPLSSATPSPATPSSSSLHFPLTKEKSFCFWLPKNINSTRKWIQNARDGNNS